MNQQIPSDRTPSPGVGWAPPEGAAVAVPPALVQGPPPGDAAGSQGAFLPRRVHGLAVAVVATSGLFGVTAWASAVLAFAAQAELERGGAGLAMESMDVLALLAIITGMVAWCLASLWLMQVYRTASAVGPTVLRRSVAWTWLAWVVPVVNFWFPKQIVDDVWRVAASQPGRSTVRSTGGWWFWWVVATIAERLSNLAAQSATAPSYVPRWRVFAALLLTAAFVQWVRVVRGVTAAHDGGPWTPHFTVLPAPVSRAAGISGPQRM